jgi:lysophospholipase
VYGNGQNLSGWLLDLDLFLPAGLNILDDKNTFFFQSVIASVVAKASTGMCVVDRRDLHTGFTLTCMTTHRDTSITDVWSRMLSYHFLNQTSRANFFTDDSSHGAGQLWSNLPSNSMFQEYNVPVPLIVFDSRPSGVEIDGYTPLNVPVYEVCRRRP